METDALRAIHDEPIPGYRLIEPLGQGGFGEVWKCEAPGGLIKAIKFVPGKTDGLDAGGCGAVQELQALQLIKSIRHPFLLSIERVEQIDGDLVLVMELAEKSLHDLLEENRSDNRSGLPRKELLGYMREVAEVLDLMNQEYGLQHLDVKPRNLCLVGRHVKVADFGLVKSLADLFGGGKIMLGGLTPLYAAPETLQGQVTLFSDQYSLAVTYHELLTGETPVKAKNARQLMLLVTTTAPDLGNLPQSDRAIVRRALAKNPRERFPSCAAFIDALESAQPLSGNYPLPRPRSNDMDKTMGDMAATIVTAELKKLGSGLYPRESRVAPAAGRPAAPASEGSLPGCTLQECLGRGPAGDVRVGSTPLGERRLVRFLTTRGFPANDRPFERLLGLRHECLPRLEVTPVGSDRVALISEAGDASLETRFKECQAASQPGIPRQELLTRLAQAADALDHLYHHCQLQHLALTPRHLALCAGEMLLLDFGLAELVWLPTGLQPAAVTPRYSAVELCNKLVSDACDQYSLALLYQELLVGSHPFRHLSAHEMAAPRLRGHADVSLLPAPDRSIVLQALHPDSSKRFRSCREFILALEEAPQVVYATAGSPPTQSGPVSVEAPAANSPPPAPPRPELQTVVDELVAQGRLGHEIRTNGTLHYRLSPGDHIEHRCRARLSNGVAQLKLEAFREQWCARLISRSETRWVMQVHAPGSLLKRCLGRVPGVVVEVTLGTAPENNANLRPLRITIRPLSCARGRSEELLTEMALELLRSLQEYFHSRCERDEQERFPLAGVVYLQSPGSDQMVKADLRDIGSGGLCVASGQRMRAGAVTIAFDRGGKAPPAQASGLVRDCVQSDAGRFEVEIALVASTMAV